MNLSNILFCSCIVFLKPTVSFSPALPTPFKTGKYSCNLKKVSENTPHFLHPRAYLNANFMISPHIIHDYDLDTLSSVFSTISSTHAASSLWTCTIPTFDGSTIVDPEVVSTVFWSSLKSKILSVIIAQFLTAGAFIFLTNFISVNTTKAVESMIAKKVSFLGKTCEDTKRSELRRNSKEASSFTETKIEPDFGKLIICLIIDTLGTSSEFLPIVGELTDIAYAPIAAYALRSLFQGSNIVFALEFTEEILPFTDVLPLASLCWIVETFYGSSDIARLLKIGEFSYRSADIDAFEKGDNSYEQTVPKRRRSKMNDEGVIDVPFTKGEDQRYLK